MKKYYLIFISLFLFSSVAFVDVPVAFEKVPNVAQYGGADWKNVIVTHRNITLEAAYKIAESNPEITYFFHMSRGGMVLNRPAPYNIFNNGDAVFFRGEPWWGSAPQSDGYIKKKAPVVVPPPLEKPLVPTPAPVAPPPVQKPPAPTPAPAPTPTTKPEVDPCIATCAKMGPKYTGESSFQKTLGEPTCRCYLKSARQQ